MTDTDDNDHPLLLEPRDGIPTPIDNQAEFDRAVARLGQGTGPLAIDVERAQSFRYESKAYLVQVRRSGAGTFLIDPIALEDGPGCADLSNLSHAIGDEEWVLHAAYQDLANLVELNIVPGRLFDTEISGRLLGHPRVNLAAMTEHYLGVRLAKQHSADDWSRRPIPESWLAYAALDVELLVELRDAMAADLRDQGKDEWARQEFAWEIERAQRPVVADDEPWRATSGMHLITTNLGAALVRELWLARDAIAKRTDTAPSKILKDRAICEAAALVKKSYLQLPTRDQLRALPGFKHSHARKHLSAWMNAVRRVAEMDNNDLPPMRRRSRHEMPQAPKSWANVKPEAFERWTTVRPLTLQAAEYHGIAVALLIAPAALKNLLWDPPSDISVAAIDERLAELEARPWQREIIAPIVAEALASERI